MGGEETDKLRETDIGEREKRRRERQWAPIAHKMDPELHFLTPANRSKTSETHTSPRMTNTQNILKT